MANPAYSLRDGPLPLLVPTTVLFFLSLLAGQFSFERIGLPNFLVIPERLFGMLFVGFVAVVLAGANARNGSPGRARFALALALPSAWGIITVFWAPVNAPELGDVVVDLSCMIIAIAVASILVRLDPWYFPLCLLWLMAAAGLLYSVAGLLTATVGSRTAVFGGGPNVYGRVTMIGFIALMGLVLLKQIPLVAAAAAPLLLIATVSSGSRGAMLAGAIAGILMLPMFRRLSTTQKFLGSVAFAIFGGFIFHRFSDVVVSTISGRVIDLTLRQGYTSGRDELTSGALELHQMHPIFGGGLRSFADFFGQGFTYPHNFLLHILSEGGMVGLTLVSAVLLATFAKALRLVRTNSMGYLFAICAVIILISSLFSGDYYDLRFLWVFLLVGLNAAAPLGSVVGVPQTSRAADN